MLGILRMTLDECYQAYIDMSKEIFKPRRNKYSWLKLKDRFAMAERFDSKAFEKIIRKIIKDRTGEEQYPLLQDGKDRPSPCQV